jgi:hypothetical protein
LGGAEQAVMHESCCAWHAAIQDGAWAWAGMVKIKMADNAAIREKMGDISSSPIKSMGAKGRAREIVAFD